jgi:RNA polymerase sigma factor (sigma-70 family)
VTDLTASSVPSSARSLPTRLLGDERLAQLAAAGSERAFARLYERHHQALYRYCRAIVRHDEDARDVLQTTMVRALAALGRGVPDAPMRPWLFRIAHNEAISLLRRRRPTIGLDRAPELEGRRLEARVEERSRLTTLVADLQELPERQRSALVMRELSGLSHEEIAGALDISVHAAKQAIFDARTGLQEFAKGRAMDCADAQRIVSERDGRMLRGRPLRAHLRSCAACRDLRDAIGPRRADLAAIAPPLPAAAATGLLSGILGGGHGGGGGGLCSGIAAKATAGALSAKALAGVAVVATVAVGTAKVLPHARVAPAREGAGAAAAAAPAARASVATRTVPSGPAVGAAAFAARAGAARVPVVATTAKAAHGASSASAAHTHRLSADANDASRAGTPRHASSSADATGPHRAGAASNAAARRPPASPPAGRRRHATPAHRAGPRRVGPASGAPSKSSPRPKPARATSAHPATPAPAAQRPSSGSSAAEMPTAGKPAGATAPAAPAAPAASATEGPAGATPPAAGAASDATTERGR